jgi:hypothetical protein
MAQGRKRGVALVAALAVITGERVRGRPRLLAAPAGPAAERATDRGLPARSRLSVVFAEVTRVARASSVITAVVAPDSRLAGVAGQVRPPRAVVTTTAFLTSSRFTAEPRAQAIPASYAPRAGVRETPASCCRIRRGGVRHAHYLVGVIPPTVR